MLNMLQVGADAVARTGGLGEERGEPADGLGGYSAVVWARFRGPALPQGLNNVLDVLDGEVLVVPVRGAQAGRAGWAVGCVSVLCSNEVLARVSKAA